MLSGLKRLVVVGFCLAGASFSLQAQDSYTLGGTWLNIPVQSQTGTFNAEFDAVPSTAGLDGVIGLSDGNATGYSSLATIVRFNSTGFIDARNAANYTAATAVPYSANVAYHFRLEVNLPAHTYSIYVTPAGGTEQLVGADYQFRSEQSGVARLNNLAGRSDDGTIALRGITISGAAVNQRPTVQITSPANGSSVTEGATVTITATASDLDGTVARVDFYNGTTLVGSDTTSPYSFAMNSVAAATLALTARAVDNLGATTISAPVNVTVEEKPPVGLTSVALAWDPSTSADVVDYRVYVSTVPGVFTTSTRAGNVTRHTVNNLLPGVMYYFAVTAISRAELESEFSNAVSTLTDAPGPIVSGGIVAGGSFRVAAQGTPSVTYVIDRSTNLVEWTPVATLTADGQGNLSFNQDATGPLGFFRVRAQ
jgi:hypothetical protein